MYSQGGRCAILLKGKKNCEKYQNLHRLQIYLIVSRLQLRIFAEILGYVYIIPDSFCAGTKTILDRASFHTLDCKTVRIFAYSTYARAIKRACETRALRARKTLTPRFTDFFTDFEKKTDCFAVYSHIKTVISARFL